MLSRVQSRDLSASNCVVAPLGAGLNGQWVVWAFEVSPAKHALLHFTGYPLVVNFVPQNEPHLSESRTMHLSKIGNVFCENSLVVLSSTLSQGADAFDHVWNWTRRLPERFGTRCRVLARGTLNNVLVEFEDGLKVVASRYAAIKVSGRERGSGKHSRGTVGERITFKPIPDCIGASSATMDHRDCSAAIRSLS
jgi:hypothetical protein